MTTADEEQVRFLRQQWATATRKGYQGHAPGSSVTKRHYDRAFDRDKRAAVISLDVPLAVPKKGGRWQSQPKKWQSMAMPQKAATTSDGTT
jgi:hypothetical protein